MRLPPNNIDAENGVLGSMMLDETALHIGLSMLEPSDFYREYNAQLFEALQALADRNELCDAITLTNEMRSRGNLDTEYILNVVESVPTAANVEHYARIVKRMSKLRKIIAMCTEIISAAYNEQDNVEDLFVDRALKLDANDNDDDGPVVVRDIIHEHIELLEARMSKQSTRLFTSGFPTMDYSFGKLGESQLIVLKGRRGRGKTHIAINTAYHAAQAGRAVVYYSLEMSAHQIIDRLMARWGGIDSHLFRSLRTSDDWRLAVSAANALYSAPVYICDVSRSVAQMHAECKRLKLAGVDIGLIVVDFAELITPPPGCQREEQELKTNARLLGDVGRDLDCTVLLLSQINKEGGERGSEGIGNRADLLLSWVCDTECSNGVLRSEKCRFGPSFAIPVHLDYKTSTAVEISDREEEY